MRCWQSYPSIPIKQGFPFHHGPVQPFVQILSAGTIVAMGNLTLLRSGWEGIPSTARRFHSPPHYPQCFLTPLARTRSAPFQYLRVSESQTIAQVSQNPPSRRETNRSRRWYVLPSECTPLPSGVRSPLLTGLPPLHPRRYSPILHFHCAPIRLAFSPLNNMFAKFLRFRGHPHKTSRR